MSVDTDGATGHAGGASATEITRQQIYAWRHDLEEQRLCRLTQSCASSFPFEISLNTAFPPCAEHSSHRRGPELAVELRCATAALHFDSTWLLGADAANPCCGKQ